MLLIFCRTNRTKEPLFFITALSVNSICLRLVHFYMFIAIPALQPIVHDLFLLRGANKSDISKELETQREVLVSMLLRLINYYQVCYKTGLYTYNCLLHVV